MSEQRPKKDSHMISESGKVKSNEITPHKEVKKFWDEEGKRLTELVTVGGWSPQEYDNVTYNEEWIYSRRGLTESEFREHIYLTSKLIGMVKVAGKENLVWIQDKISEHLENSLNNMKNKTNIEEENQ